MKIESFLDREFLKMQNKGTEYTKEEWMQLRQKLTDISKISSFERVLEYYLEDLEKETQSFLKTRSLTGISVSIAFDACYLNLVGGTSIQGEAISPSTLFDVASITKLYTVLLSLFLCENHILSFNEKVTDISPAFSHLCDYTVEDLLYMKGEIRTSKRLDSAKSKKEALRILESLYVYNADKNAFVYTDMGMITLARLMEKRIREKLSLPLGYADIMKLILLEPLELYQTTFFPKGKVAGNGRQDTRVHDPKARVLGGICGSAGIYTNAHDLYFLSQELFSVIPILSKESLSKLTENPFHRNKAIGGLYQKFPDLSKTYVPKEYSDKTFASEGSTGSVALFDMEYHLHNAILVDSIEPTTEKKPVSFKENYNMYQTQVTDKTMELFLLEKYYDAAPYKSYVFKI